LKEDVLYDMFSYSSCTEYQIPTARNDNDDDDGGGDNDNN